MCTHPITITKTYPLVGTKTYTVPCGKCAECVNKKRSEIAALSVHQGFVSGDVRFFTLTYSNDHCPVAIYDHQLEKVVGFERGVSDWMKNGDFMNCVHEDGLFSYTPSLCREDVKLWFKQFRSAWKRSHGDTPKFKYLVFGEYGDSRGRPHYHCLIYGLSVEQVEFLSAFWELRFGFTKIVPSPDKVLSTDDIIAISKYVSKYISKGVHQRFAHILPFVEKPRRQSSLDFGQFSDDELRRYASFMMAAISSDLLSPVDCLDGLQILNFLWSQIAGKLSRLPEMSSHSLNL